MSRNSNSGLSGGLSFESLLQVAFIVLKLCKVITWSWIWVLSPTWIPTIILVVVIIVAHIHKKRR